jgi:hypothetical protein
MDALGEDMEKYLWEAGEKEFDEKRKAQELADKKKKKSLQSSMAMSALDPFLSVFRGFGEFFTLFVPIGGGGKEKKEKRKGAPEEAEKSVAVEMYLMYKNYKKGHGMLSW